MATMGSPARGFSRSYLDLSMAHWRMSSIVPREERTEGPDPVPSTPSSDPGDARRAEDGPVHRASARRRLRRGRRARLSRMTHR